MISSLMLKKNFIENGRKMTKLEAFFERPSLIEQLNSNAHYAKDSNERYADFSIINKHELKVTPFFLKT